jgi:tRNA dimethylallyltransferase
LVVQERLAFSPLIIGLSSSVERRRERIYLRLKERLASGLIEEVQELLDNGVHANTLEYYGLEYKFVSRYLHGQLTLPELEERLLTAIYQFAKRQMTFFRKMEKDGVTINWYDSGTPYEEIKSSIIKNLDFKF